MTDRGRVLIVDDDEELRDTLREYFEISGFVVYSVGDGESNGTEWPPSNEPPPPEP